MEIENMETTETTNAIPQTTPVCPRCMKDVEFIYRHGDIVLCNDCWATLGNFWLKINDSLNSRR